MPDTPADIAALIERLQHHAPYQQLATDAAAALAELREEVVRLTQAQNLDAFEPLLKPPIKHGRACAFLSNNEERCTCGYEWRIRLSTEMALHNAWVKRTTEAEARIAELERERDRIADQLVAVQSVLAGVMSERDATAALAQAMAEELLDLRGSFPAQKHEHLYAAIEAARSKP
jgi:hypothetical protein